MGKKGGGGSQHLADTLVDARVRRKRGDFAARQLRHTHLPLLGRLLGSHQRDLLLRDNSLRLDLADQLPHLPSAFKSAAFRAGDLPGAKYLLERLVGNWHVGHVARVVRKPLVAFNSEWHKEMLLRGMPEFPERVVGQVWCLSRTVWVQGNMRRGTVGLSRPGSMVNRITGQPNSKFEDYV